MYCSLVRPTCSTEAGSPIKVLDDMGFPKIVYLCVGRRRSEGQTLSSYDESGGERERERGKEQEGDQIMHLKSRFSDAEVSEACIACQEATSLRNAAGKSE